MSEFSPTTDIYDISDQVKEIMKTYIDDENESTLALGIFGFVGDTLTKEIQTDILMTGELGNEMFPTRAKLDKNVTTHAIYTNVEGINAVPAHMEALLGIKVTDFEAYCNNNQFIFTKDIPIMINRYEFHLDYDIILQRKVHNEQWIYNAYYDFSEYNPISDITNPYLNQPYVVNFDNYEYIFLRVLVRQITIETTTDVIVSSSIIDNKSFTFGFTDQLADFIVYVTDNGRTKRLKPLMYGQPVDPGVNDYCWYLYMNDQNIRIGFDQNSYIPGINATIKVVAFTTIGAEGNFSYKSFDKDAGTFVDFKSTYYNNKIISCYVNCLSESTDGQDKKSIDELKGLVPKMALSRGYITTETDLNGYFNIISNNFSKLKLQKKVDNQLNRIWYCYMVAKDESDNVIPTNTIHLRVSPLDDYVKIDDSKKDNKRYIIPCGTTFRFDADTGYAEFIKEDEIPAIYSEEYFNDRYYYYRTWHNVIINSKPLYSAYYNTLVCMDGFFEYIYLNDNVNMGFIALTNHMQRNLLTDINTYKFTFNMSQSVRENYGLYNSITGENNMKVFLVVCMDGSPYRFIEGHLTKFDMATYESSWEIDLETDNTYDITNRIKLVDMYEAGNTSKNYGFFNDNCEAYVYIYAKFEDEYFGQEYTNDVIPEELVEGYSAINIYKIAEGVDLFTNYTDMINSRVYKSEAEDSDLYLFDILGVPVVGYHYFLEEYNVMYLTRLMNQKKAYIDYCLTVLENNMDIDFKFFNTYGYSYTYTLGDKEETSIVHIDTTWKFRCKLANINDITTKTELNAYIKSYIEDLNMIDDKELHIPNLLHDIKEQFGDLLIYIEYMNFNGNRLGLNHIELRDIDNPHIVPEFINVRNYLTDMNELVPNIEIEYVVDKVD